MRNDEAHRNKKDDNARSITSRSQNGFSLRNEIRFTGFVNQAAEI